MRGDAVLNGEHTFYLILEAADTDKVQEFMSSLCPNGQRGDMACQFLRSGGEQGPLLEHASDRTLPPLSYPLTRR